MTERPNKELADRYWSDPTLMAWYWNTAAGRWVAHPNPSFEDCATWHVGHEAPKEPPARMCELAGIKFPMPMTEAPKLGEDFMIVTLEGVAPVTWDGSAIGFRWLKQRRCHKTRAAAEQHYEAICAANQQAIEGAK